ncbi:MAG: hypothetical protein SH821_09145 [Phototrophicales bacterium]|nr:hypothetical protein [Phototrophicales bacterium]
MKETLYAHPKPLTNHISQLVVMVGVAFLVISTPFQILLGFSGGTLFFLAAFFSLLLTLPLLMSTVIAPAIKVDDDGLTVMPVIWKSHTVTWVEISAVKPYPLLPPADAEVTRKIAVGRVKYAPANGIMLVIPKLSWMYRIGGFFAGEHRQPIIAITNRAHSHYTDLVYVILDKTDPQIHDDELKAKK